MFSVPVNSENVLVEVACQEPEKFQYHCLYFHCIVGFVLIFLHAHKSNVIACLNFFCEVYCEVYSWKNAVKTALLVLTRPKEELVILFFNL